MTMLKALWDRCPVDASFGISLLCSREMNLTLSQRVLNISRHLIEQHTQDSLDLFLVGKFTLFDVDNIGLLVDRVEYNLGKSMNISCLPEEILIHFRITENVTPPLDYDKAVQRMFQSLSTALPNLELSTCFQIFGRMAVDGSEKTSCLLETKSTSSKMEDLNFVAIFMDCPLSLTPVPVVPLINCALSRSLETSVIYPMSSPRTRNILDPIWDARFGYISLTKDSKYALHLDADPTVMSSTLVGIWVSGVELIFDPRIWNLCIRFMMSELLTSEVRSIKRHPSSSAPRDSMLLLFYGINTGPPTCYDVRFGQVTQSDDGEQLFYASTPLHFRVRASTDPTIQSNGKTLTLRMEEPPSLQHNSRSSLSAAVAKSFPDIFLPHSRSPKSNVVADRKSKNIANVHEDEPESFQTHCTNSPPPSDFNIPEVSLLVEEGVATSFPESNANRISTPHISPHDQDSIPRDPPQLINVLSSRKTQASPHPCSYDPRRYQSPSVTDGHQMSVHSSSYAERSEFAVPESTNSAASSPCNPNSLQALLAKLPATQLRRLEGMISELLAKDNNAVADPTHSVVSRFPQTCQIEKPFSASSVDVGVNTTTTVLLASTRSVRLSHPYSSTQCSSLQSHHGNFIGFVPNDAGVDLDTDYGLTSSLEMQSNRSGSNHADVSKTGAAKPTVGDSPSFSHGQDVSETINPTPVHIDQPISHGICGISSTAAENSNKLNTVSAKINDDRFSDLLAGIQTVLNRQTKVQQNEVVKQETPSRFLSFKNNRSSAELSEQTSKTHDKASQEKNQCLIPVRLFDPMVDQLVGERTLVGRERVTSWLSDNRQHPTGPSLGSRSTLTTDQPVADRNTGRVADEFLPDPEIRRPRPVSCEPVSSLIGADESLHLSTTMASTAPTQSLTDTDQSVFLAKLVEKYLGTKLPPETSRRGIEADITRYGGLNPNNLSMATENYLRRHRMLEPTTREQRLGKTKSTVYTSTPACGPSLASSRAFRFATKAPTSRDAENKDPSRSVQSDYAIPNVLDGLELDRSPLSDTIANHDPDIKMLLPPLAELSSLFSFTGTTSTMGRTMRPKEVDHNPSRADQSSSELNNIDGSGLVLDIERLRSLPKLL